MPEILAIKKNPSICSGRFIGCCIVILLWMMPSHDLHSQDYRYIVDSLEKQLPLAKEYDSRLKILSECLRVSLYNDVDLAYSYVLRFEKEAKLSGDSSEIARSKNFFGMQAATAGDHHRAISEYEDALLWYEALHDTMMIGMMYNNIGAAYEFQADREKSIEYFHTAYEFFQKAGQEDWAFFTKFNIAEQYYAQNRLLEAEPIYLEAMPFFESEGYYNEFVQTQVKLARINFLMVGAAEAIHLVDAISIDERVTDKATLVLFEVLYCEMLTELDRLREARDHCDRSVQIAEDFGGQKERASAYATMYGYLKKKGEFEQALDVHERLLGLNDSVVNAMKDKQIVNLLTKYEIREKEKEIGVKDLQLEQKEQQANYFRILLILIGIGLVGAAIFTFSRIRTNRKLRKQKELIQKSLNDRELLLREIHHRVKNNLQVISSILSIQSREIKDATALKAVNEARARVKSMALIHQDLYGEENLRGIKAQPYITKLSNSLFSTYRVDKDRVRLHTDIQDLLIDVDTTVPLGLILNELVTNSLKYAFPDEREGDIHIEFNEKEGALRLNVWDNGIGIPEEKKEASRESFGMKMIRAFSKKLDATWEIDGEGGTSVSLVIKNYKLAG
ncbi:MAG: tetratricopeptide repeat protein [Flavobacteriales bacterium]|nr:tetratricopeptide repeat protein [Flavobacteriales bacterium]